MQITTKFDVGDSVVFLHNNCFTRREITRIEIEASKQDGKESHTIKYYFANLEKDYSNRGYYVPDYKYENEIASTKEELADLAQEY